MVEAISWRDVILQELLPPVTPLTLAADPDCLLTEERILKKLQDHGYEVLVFQDPIEFRFNYELQYRDRLHPSEPQYLIVAIQEASQSLQNLPYDVVKAGRQLTFGLANLFSNLSYTVVKQLDLNCLDRLYQETRRLSKRLGENGTKDFVLRHVFEITPEAIQNEVEQEQRLLKLIRHLSDSLPTPGGSHQAWLSFAPRWAELLVLRSQSSTSAQSKHEPSFVQLQQQVDTTFLNWIQLHYGGLFNQAATVMIHHIPRLMMRQLESMAAQKVALLVLDGMALDQWIILRNVIQATNPRLKFHESAVFAWLPTITSVSRQALFSGKSPSSFPSSINSTHKEEALWCRFWIDQGISKSAIAYAKSLGEEDSLSIVEDLLTRPKLRVLGLVVNSIDERMHHAMDGITGFHKQVAHWAEMRFTQNIINLLLEQNFTIFLTSDHGNIEAIGIGSPSERAIADLRGERVRVYNNETLKQQVKEKFPDVFDWTPSGLPKDYLPLFSPGRAAFVSKGEKVIGHGGLSIEELIVPLVQIQRSNL